MSQCDKHDEIEFSQVSDPTNWNAKGEFDSLTFASYTDAKKAEVMFNRLLRDLHQAESDKNWLRAQRDVAEANLKETAPSSTRPSVPAGWKLVPEQWTTEMAHAGYEVHKNDKIACYECGQIYTAMLASAPTYGPGPGVDVSVKDLTELQGDLRDGLERRGEAPVPAIEPNDLEKAWQMLEVCGVPRERAHGNLARGIEVLSSRLAKEEWFQKVMEADAARWRWMRDGHYLGLDGEQADRAVDKAIHARADDGAEKP